MSSCSLRESQQSRWINSISSLKSSIRMVMVRLRRARWLTSSEDSSRDRPQSNWSLMQILRQNSRLLFFNKRMRSLNSNWVFLRDLWKKDQAPSQTLRTLHTRPLTKIWKQDSDLSQTSTIGRCLEINLTEIQNSSTWKTFKTLWAKD